MMSFTNWIPEKVFVDTGEWIARANRRDRHHAQATAIYERLQQQPVKLYTTDYVIDETVTRITYDASHFAAVQFLDFIHDTLKKGELTLERVDEEAFALAEELFRQYNTARLAFTDCTSFVICKEYHIFDVFGFDRHFEVAELNLLR